MSDVVTEANEKRKLIVSTNNIGASNAYRETVTPPNLPAPAERKEVKPVVKYKPQKETFGSKLKKAIFGTDHVDNIPEYLVLKVAVLALKQTFYDMFCGGLGMMFGMERKGGKKSGYTGYYGGSSRDRDDDDDYDDSMPDSYRDIWFPTRSDAEDVVGEMETYCREQGYVTVLEFYGISDRRSPNSRRDDKKGWDRVDLKGARNGIFKRGGKWYIDLPRPTLISDMRGE